LPVVRPYGGKTPQIGEGTFLAENAVVVGDVVVGARSSIWYGAVVRGDVFYIRIGDETSIQDNSVIHVSHGRNATIVGNRVTVGHSVNLHGCVIHDRCIIGMGSIVLDGAEVGERCIVGAGSLVTPETRIPPGTLSLGSPARPRRDLTAEELAWLDVAAQHYVELAAGYLR
jgi:carbonic anhydrase/acetyltransferase-like protein (isoleucine patch superfamily)